MTTSVDENAFNGKRQALMSSDVTNHPSLIALPEDIFAEVLQQPDWLFVDIIIISRVCKLLHAKVIRWARVYGDQSTRFFLGVPEPVTIERPLVENHLLISIDMCHHSHYVDTLSFYNRIGGHITKVVERGVQNALWTIVDKSTVASEYPDTQVEFVELTKSWAYAIIPQYFNQSPSNKKICERLWSHYQATITSGKKIDEVILCGIITLLRHPAYHSPLGPATGEGKRSTFCWSVEMCCGTSVICCLSVWRSSWKELLASIKTPTLDGVSCVPVSFVK